MVGYFLINIIIYASVLNNTEAEKDERTFYRLKIRCLRFFTCDFDPGTCSFLINLFFASYITDTFGAITVFYFFQPK